ncbi:hypothetical protein [Nocardia salmonicida]|uniref:hypothetical protein n=1 Tax=Nocardia salmonicida TaxID=53431 RepID=UPI0007A4761E|nr:hypothetical protein [Nocardia salmonicida]
MQHLLRSCGIADQREPRQATSELRLPDIVVVHGFPLQAVAINREITSAIPARAAVVGKIWPAELIASVNSDFFVPGLAGWERGSRGTLILCPSGRISDNSRIAEPATGWAVGFVVCWGMAMPVTG